MADLGPKYNSGERIVCEISSFFFQMTLPCLFCRGWVPEIFHCFWVKSVPPSPSSGVSWWFEKYEKYVSEWKSDRTKHHEILKILCFESDSHRKQVVFNSLQVGDTGVCQNSEHWHISRAQPMEDLLTQRLLGQFSGVAAFRYKGWFLSSFFPWHCVSTVFCS